MSDLPSSGIQLDYVEAVQYSETTREARKEQRSREFERGWGGGLLPAAQIPPVFVSQYFQGDFLSYKVRKPNLSAGQGGIGANPVWPCRKLATFAVWF